MWSCNFASERVLVHSHVKMMPWCRGKIWPELGRPKERLAWAELAEVSSQVKKLASAIIYWIGSGGYGGKNWSCDHFSDNGGT